MPNDIESIIRRANDELINKGNLEVVEEFFTTSYLAHGDGKEFHGHDFVRKFIGILRNAIPDAKVTAIDILLVSGESVAWQRTLTGTHEANMMGIPPSGKRVKWMEMVVSRFEDGKVAEDWLVSDLAGKLMAALPTR